MDIVHRLPEKKFMCVEPDNINPVYTPVTPLSKCNACSRGITRRHAITAVHLRRRHFLPKRMDPKTRQISEAYQKAKEKGHADGNWPPMSEVRRWMQPVAEFIKSSGGITAPAVDEAEEHKADEYGGAEDDTIIENQ